jgi:hypothetical protein
MDTEPVPEVQQAPSDWHGDADRSAQDAEQAPAEWQGGEDQGQASEEAPAEWQASEEPAQEAQQAPAEWQAPEEHPPEAEQAPTEWRGEDTQPAEEAPAEWHAEAGQPQPTEADTAPAEFAETEQASPEAAPAEWGESSVSGGAPAEEEPAREWSAHEPRVPEGESQEFQPDVPQDAWEDEPVEDATEAPAQWTESAEGEGGEASAFAAETPAAGGPIALPGPKEPATSYEPAPGDAEESTDRFRTPRATPVFGVESSPQEPAQREDRTDEWPPQEATREEVEWVASPEPLSAADIATLGALGIEPGDGTGAMRALACLIRVLNRRQAIDVEELAAEIRESRTSSVAEVASSEGNPGGEPTGPFAGSRD